MKNKKPFEHAKTRAARVPLQKQADTSSVDKPFVPLTRKNVLELRIVSLDEDGYGTARSEEGMTLKVGGALPGDVVLAGVDHVAGGTAFCHVKKCCNHLSCEATILLVAKVLIVLAVR